jgi:hypothetical protein
MRQALLLALIPEKLSRFCTGGGRGMQEVRTSRHNGAQSTGGRQSLIEEAGGVAHSESSGWCIQQGCEGDEEGYGKGPSFWIVCVVFHLPEYGPPGFITRLFSSPQDIGPQEGSIACPVATSSGKKRDRVPCRISSHARRSTEAGCFGRLGCVHPCARYPWLALSPG